MIERCYECGENPADYMFDIEELGGTIEVCINCLDRAEHQLLNLKCVIRMLEGGKGE